MDREMDREIAKYRERQRERDGAASGFTYRLQSTSNRSDMTSADIGVFLQTMPAGTFRRMKRSSAGKLIAPPLG
jgi:hypothetical protein